MNKKTPNVKRRKIYSIIFFVILIFSLYGYYTGYQDAIVYECPRELQEKYQINCICNYPEPLEERVELYYALDDNKTILYHEEGVYDNDFWYNEGYGRPYEN